MGYKSILVHLDDRESCASRVKVAAALALRFQAHLTGLYATDHSPLKMSAAKSVAGVELERLRREKLQQLRDRAATLFREATAQMPVSADWHAVPDDPLSDSLLHSVEQLARCADLTVVGQTAPEDNTVAIPADFPEVLCLAAGRPVLIVPYASRRVHIGERIMVGWDGSRKAARALSDSLPLLKRAKAVKILTLTALDEAAKKQDDVLAFLQRHGISARGTIAEAGDMGHALLAHVSGWSADLLVMGAYGHSRLRELVLGGATRTVLQSMTVPVLISH
jgi:nucleotide-binding universal stress UspA family protein